MKIKEIRETQRRRNSARANVRLSEEIFHLRIQQQSGQLEKPSQLRTLRREIARIETVLTQKTRPPRAATTKCHDRTKTDTVDSHAKSRGLRKERVGQVVSNKMQKTAVVETVTRVPHPKFGKIIKQVKRFYVHDEEGKAQIGDTVRIMETRPLCQAEAVASG